MPLSVQAPTGAHFEFDEVKTNHGTQSLGDVPILVWDDPAAATAQYGAEGICNILDGTSLRVSFQAIGRRMRAAGKTDDEIATAQLAFRPGTRQVGVATPVSRAAKAAKSAAEKVDGDIIAAFMAKVASGEISAEDMKSFVG